MKRHFATGPVTTACGIGKVTTTNVYQVDCLNCQAKPEFIKVKAEVEAAKRAAFEAQVPHTVRNPWTGQNILCSNCGQDLFRDMDRDLFTWWFKCSACDKVQGYPTETGMCS